MPQVTARSDVIPAPTYTPLEASVGRSHWSHAAILYAIGHEPHLELSPFRSALVATAVKASDALARLDAMSSYAGSQPPHLADLRQRTVARLYAVLDLLGLPHEAPALPPSQEA